MTLLINLLFSNKQFIKGLIFGLMLPFLPGIGFAQAPFTQLNSGLANVKDGSSAWGDHDNDGDLDILITGANWNAQSSSYVAISHIYQNNNGVFTNINAGLTGVMNSAAAWGDYDNDGDLDILLTGYTGTGFSTVSYISQIYRNDNGTFININAGLLGLGHGSVAWGDYDNDGDLDILITGTDFSLGISKIYRNDAGLFTDINAALTGVRSSSVAWGDYDKDGDLDILLSGANYINASSHLFAGSVYRNDNGIFTNINAALAQVQYSAAAWGDYDNDGDLDILLTGNTDNFSGNVSNIYQNNSGVFTNINAGLPGVHRGSSAWGDYDNDGDLDILLTGDPGPGAAISHIYQNNNGLFTNINAGLFGVEFSSVAWGDYDNDEDLDILLTGTDNSVVGPSSLIYQNNTAQPNTLPSMVSGLGFSGLPGRRIKLTWNKGNDAQTPRNGISYNVRIGTAPDLSNIASSNANSQTGYQLVPKHGSICDTTFTVNNLLPGTYYWSVQAVDGGLIGGPWAVEQSFTVHINTGINENLANSNSINIYPNPASLNSTIKISLNKNISGLKEINIYNNLGKIVFSKQITDGQDIFNLSLKSLKSGLYQITIRNKYTTESSKLLIL